MHAKSSLSGDPVDEVACVYDRAKGQSFVLSTYYWVLHPPRKILPLSVKLQIVRPFYYNPLPFMSAFRIEAGRNQEITPHIRNYRGSPLRSNNSIELIQDPTPLILLTGIKELVDLFRPKWEWTKKKGGLKMRDLKTYLSVAPVLLFAGGVTIWVLSRREAR
ncbi:hypothetical protein Ahy_B06g081066 [Arachis hypogaea]|uniref:Uncharacterized protein n=1 Tax=Arachis hypogaea TaxID=3818 RepID=A0A444YK23_ARAHY|nr:hypothetical protein Ahy_B06g081066 [Arachis hypogaea]